MFLLFLIGLGTADVNAQVRIGGNVAPNASALLDLNATDATNNGTKGLALPRVNLTSDTMRITTGVANLTGMLVFNTTATLGAGIYFWSGSNWIPTATGNYRLGNSDTVALLSTRPTVTFTLAVDTTWQSPRNVTGMSSGQIIIPGLTPTDICFDESGWDFFVNSYSGRLIWYRLMGPGPTNTTVAFRIRCYRPSI